MKVDEEFKKQLAYVTIMLMRDYTNPNFIAGLSFLVAAALKDDEALSEMIEAMDGISKRQYGEG